MPPPPDLSHHILPEPVSKEIFQTQILPADLPATLTPHPTRARPLAVLIVGQTGAGKTRTAPAVLSAMNRINPPAHFIADVYKAHHPSYLTLISSPNPAHASPATGPDARKWLAMAAAEAISRKLDVLLESACRHPDDFRDLARMFGEAGYRVEVVVMAVPAALSRLGILHRFYERLPEAGSGNLPIRLTPVKIHDDSYAGLMSVAEWIDEVDYIDRVLVVRRGNLVACSDDKNETAGRPYVEGHELEVELGEVTPTFQKPPRKSAHAWSSRRTSSPTPLISKDNFVVTMRAKWRKKRVRRLKRKRRKMRARSK
ncbi:hypothetical protein KHU50_005970 [Colletotrichum sp. SAR 10_65]|nr:hypothetical protein KHU50_005970 [Colletotrichum sp. SAR 10_65]